MKQVLDLKGAQIVHLTRLNARHVIMKVLPPTDTEYRTFAFSCPMLAPQTIEVNEIGGSKQKEDIPLDTGLILEVIARECKISRKDDKWRIEVTLDPKRSLIVADAPSLFAASMLAYVELRNKNVIEPHDIIDPVVKFLSTFFKDMKEWLENPNESQK